MGVSQNEDLPPDAPLPQLDALRQAGHAEGEHPLPLEDAGHRQGPVAVGVGLHGGHQLAARGQQGPEGRHVVDQGRPVQLDPGPAKLGHLGAQPPQHPGDHPRRQEGQQAHHQVLDQAVAHQNLGEAHHLGPAPEDHQHGGVEDIHPGGQGPAGRRGLGRPGQQQPVQEAHHQGQQQVHAVVPLQAQVAQEEALPGHQSQGEGQPQAGCPGQGGRAPLAHLGPQKQEEGGHKQAVAGVGEEVEPRLIQAGQGGDLGGEAVVAVPQQGDGVEHAHRHPQPPPPEHPGQAIHHQQPHGAGGEVPQVVEGAVKDQQPHPVQKAQVLVVAGIPADGEVEDHRHQVQQQDLPHLPPQGGKGALALQHLPQDEVAGDHEEEGHRHPGQAPGEEEVPCGRVGGQGGDVDGHHQQGGQDSKGVQPAVGAGLRHGPPPIL